MFRINEVFRSLQGEGPFAGYVTTFIRMCGCNLRCSFCDTAYARQESDEDLILEVVETMLFLEQHDLLDDTTKYVCITGGEPLLQPQVFLGAFVKLLLARNIHVCIETNGSIRLPNPLWNCCFVVDYKLPSSGVEKQMIFNNFFQLRSVDAIKFVIQSEEDWKRFMQVYMDVKKTLQGRSSPMFFVQPALSGGELSEARERGIWLAEKLMASRVEVRLSLQLHKILWGMQRRK